MEVEIIPTIHDLAPEGDVVFLLDSRNESSRPPTSVIVIDDASSLDNGSQSKDLYVQDIRIRVSSAHLKLVSSVFKSLLSGNLREGSALRSYGYVEIPLPEDPPQALLILLSIIHSAWEYMPRQINVDLLLRIVVLADKYDMSKILKQFSREWVRRARPPTSWDYRNRDWLTIFKILQIPTEFRNCVAWQLEHSRGVNQPIPASCLPIGGVLGR